MAWLERNPTSGRYKISFRWEGRKVRRTIRAKTQVEAESVLARLEETLDLVERGRIEVPGGVDVATFLLSDGKLASSPTRDRQPARPLTAGELAAKYLATHSNGAREANTLLTVRIHLNHVSATLGEAFALERLTLADLQRHVDRRCREKGCRGKSVSACTIRKELSTFRATVNWARSMGLLRLVYPAGELALPKADEKAPFQTIAEFERQLGRGGLSAAEEAALWACLYLTSAEVEELLAVVRAHAGPAFLFPMAATAFHTGARRSELLRARVEDVDFGSKTVLLREKKRARGKRTSRRVPLSRFLERILTQWLSAHPGGAYLFCQTALAHSRTARPSPQPVTKYEAHDHLRRALAGSRYGVVRGWHVARHSFISNAAAAGVDQRLLDEWVGHTTEEMRKRYRHLFPDHQRRAIDAVFVA
jgi:integrase